ncbi:MAG TPA: hypothetical protein VK866_09240, partial [Acidimicrobiales bacterium]|nr:hypothetical protein [Acidimicrobiales bacterium]
MTLASPRRPLGTTRSARGVRPAIAVVAVAVLAAGCGGERPQLADAPPPTVVATTAPPVEAPTTSAADAVGAAAPAGWDPAAPVLVAEAVGDTVEVFATLEGRDPERVLDRADEISGTLVFVVVGEVGDRLEVQLPVRP